MNRSDVITSVVEAMVGLTSQNFHSVFVSWGSSEITCRVLLLKDDAEDRDALTDVQAELVAMWGVDVRARIRVDILNEREGSIFPGDDEVAVWAVRIPGF